MRPRPSIVKKCWKGRGRELSVRLATQGLEHEVKNDADEEQSDHRDVKLYITTDFVVRFLLELPEILRVSKKTLVW